MASTDMGQPIAVLEYYGHDRKAGGAWTEGSYEIFTFPQLKSVERDMTERGLRYGYDWSDYWKSVTRKR